MIPTEIFIRGSVPSLKNTKIVARGRLVTSPTVTKWRKESKADWIANKDKFISMAKGLYPVFVHLTFIKPIDNLWDFTALTETIADEMVKYGYINDDNHYQFVPCFGRPKIDRVNPGTKIRILKSPPKFEFV